MRPETAQEKIHPRRPALTHAPMNSPYPFTRGVKTLLAANGAVFLLQLMPGIGRWVTGIAALVPYEAYGRGQLWRLVSYMFLHSTTDIFHLFLNMLALWMFGGVLEERWGTKRFIGLYLLFGTGAALFGAFYCIDPAMRLVPIIGASGAIFGLLTAYAVYHPDSVVLFFFVLPMRAWVLVAGYAVLSFMLAFSHGSGVAHLIHLGGIAVAFAYLKGGPRLTGWHEGVREMRNERNMRRRAEEQAGRKRYYEENVDPILEKIAREGEGALTEEEKKVLTEVWKYKRQ
jgi:membrane associated rhomboid family serine protease